MKIKRAAVLGVTLAIALVGILPTTTLAKTDTITASGVVTSISESIEFYSGNSGRVKVMDRDIFGTFQTGDILGDYILSYKANVDLDTQSGNFSGKLDSGPYSFSVNGTSNPVTWIPVEGGYIGQLTSSGDWQLIAGGGGAGSFESSILFVPTPEGHVAYVLPGSYFNMTGNGKLTA